MIISIYCHVFKTRASGSDIDDDLVSILGQLD